jgi:hypothetical protein
VAQPVDIKAPKNNRISRLNHPPDSTTMITQVRHSHFPSFPPKKFSFQIFVVVAIAASASAIATSYAVGGLPLGGLEGGLGLGRIGGLGLGRIGGIGLEGGIGGIGLGGGIGGIGLGGGRLIGGHERVVDVYVSTCTSFEQI